MVLAGLLFFLLFYSEPSYSKIVNECRSIYEFNSEFTIPLPEQQGHHVQRQIKAGHKDFGFLHEFTARAITFDEKMESPFQIFDRRIKQAEKWFGLFGISRPDAQSLVLSDLVFLSSTVTQLKKQGFKLAPSLIPGTYSGKGPISSLGAVQMMAEGKFVVSTGNKSLWFHDLFGHGLPGYLLLPSQVASRLIDFSRLLVSLSKGDYGPNLNRQVREEVELFAGFFDELTQQISIQLRNGDYESLWQHLDFSLRTQVDRTRRFLSTLNKSGPIFNSQQLSIIANIEQNNRNFTKAELYYVHTHIIDAFTGNFLEPILNAGSKEN